MKQSLREVASVGQEQALKFRYGMLSRSWRPLIPEGGMEGSCEQTSE